MPALFKDVCRDYNCDIYKRIVTNYLRQHPDGNISDLVLGKMSLPTCFHWGNTPEGYRFWKSKQFLYLYSSIKFANFILLHTPSLQPIIKKSFVNLKKTLAEEDRKRDAYILSHFNSYFL